MLFSGRRRVSGIGCCLLQLCTSCYAHNRTLFSTDDVCGCVCVCVDVVHVLHWNREKKGKEGKVAL